MAKLVAKTYGDALFELALESGRIDLFLEEAESVLAIWQENKELGQLMNHPKIVKEEKITVVENIFKGRIADELMGLLCMLLTKDHYDDITDVLDYFIQTVKEYKKIGIAQVTTAVELSDVQKEAVEKRLLETTDYVAFEMKYEVDEGLIGGMVIRIKDRVVDSSIRTKLASLTSELTKIQLKVGECAP